MLRIARALGLAAVAAAVLVVASARADDTVADHTFPDLHGHDGRTSLAALRGQPVLFATWRPNVGEGALALAASLATKYGSSGLVVILSCGDLDWAASRAYLQDRYGLTSAWTCGATLVPVEYAGPNEAGRIAVVSADGRCLVAGIARALGGKIEDAVEREIAKRRAGHGDDAAAKKARALAFGKGRLGEARTALSAAPGAETADRTLAKAEIERDHARRVAAIGWMRDRGAWTRARALAKDLAAAVVDYAEWEKEAAEIGAGFETDDAKRAIALAEEVESLSRGLRPGKASAVAAAKLEAFAKEHQGTPAAAFASEAAALARALAAR